MTAKELGDQPAFPLEWATSGGLTKLELFTALAMNGELASFQTNEVWTPAKLAAESLVVAKAQLEALAKEMT